MKNMNPFDTDHHYLLSPHDVARHLLSDHVVAFEAATQWLRSHGIRPTMIGNTKLDAEFARVNLAILGVDNEDYSDELAMSVFMHHLAHSVVEGNALVFDRAGVSYR